VRLYEGQSRPSSEVATVHIRGNGVLEQTAQAGEIGWQAALVAFDGKPTADPLHMVEVLPGHHELTVEWKRYEVPIFTTWGPRWGIAGSGTNKLFLTAVAGKTYALEFHGEWGEERQPGEVPMAFVEK